MEHRLNHPGGAITYRLKLSPRRRTVGMRVDAAGLTVHAPSRLGRKMLENMLLERVDWIVTKLSEWENRCEPPVVWQDGERLLHFGQPITLNISAGARDSMPVLEGNRLLVSLRDPDDGLLVRRKVMHWYRREALDDFSRRVDVLAARLAVARPRLYLSNARTHWGSCNSRGEVRLNWRLVQAPPHIIHYVAAHELAHLKEMNHSPDFWRLVERLCPDFAAARDALKSLSSQLHRLG